MARSIGLRRVLEQATAASRYARRTGCGIDEATAVIADGADDRDADEARAAAPGARRTRRQFLQGATAAAIAATVPTWLTAPARAAAGAGERIVIVGGGIAGLGCAYRLWRRHGIRSEVYEFNAERAGGRIQTLRGYFDGGQYTEQHGEFISSEHTRMRRLAASFGLSMDNTDLYVAHTRDVNHFGGINWPLSELNREWHEWGWQLFHDAAFNKAPWPTLYNRSTEHGRRWDHMSVPEWLEAYIPGGLDSNFGRLCIANVLDEYGGRPEQQSALNLVYILGQDDSHKDGDQPRSTPLVAGTDEKWHIHGGNDQVISAIIARLPAGTVRLGQELVSLRPRGHGRYAAAFATGGSIHEVVADHVVLALPFTKLRQVDLGALGIPAIQLRAIREEPLGDNAKVQLQFSRRAWDSDGDDGNLLTGSVAQSGWEATTNQPGTEGILIALPGGDAGRDLGPRYGLRSYFGPAPHALVRDYLASFEQSFPGVTAAYNGKSYYQWSSGDPHLLGAYSYLAVGQFTGFNGVQGRRAGNVHFAGEHTSINFQGFMEGGLRTGYRCATEIAG